MEDWDATASWEAAAPELWSDPASWDGAVPGPDDIVVVERGRTLLLDADADVAGLVVLGRLEVADTADIALETDWMLVSDGGAFVVGTPEDPHAHDFTLTLAGDPGEAPDWAEVRVEVEERCPVSGGTCLCALADRAPEGTAFLMAHGEGSRIEIHGADAAKLDWTRLAATAEPGAREIVLEAAPGWEAGDEIVLASTDFDAHQAETARILSVSPDGRTLTLDRALDWMHFGELQLYEGGRVLDTRAEVGLLSRNVTIRGDEDAHLDGHGGHTMAMHGAELRLSGVEFHRMGQAGEMGRYPVHWHMTGDAAGQYVTNSAFHESYNRAVVVHGTQNALVADTVAYDTVGHAYFLEDGSETGNVFHRNLGLLTRAAAPEAATAPTDASHVSTFWISNPSNEFVGNVAAGSEHSGFWIAPGQVTGLSAATGLYDHLDPATAPLGRFDGNVGHSNAHSNLAIEGSVHPDTLEFVESDYRPSEPAVIRDFTSYKSLDRAVWVRAEGIEFDRLHSADNARATFFSYNQLLNDGLIVGRSANVGTPLSQAEIAAGRSLPEPYNGRYFRGHSIYDGPSGVIDTHFAGFTDADAAFQTNGAAQKSPAHYASGLSFEGVTAAGRVDFAPEAHLAHMWSSGLLDLDGSLTGTPGARLVPILEDAQGAESRVHIPETAERRDDWGAWAVAGDMGLLRADTDLAPGTALIAGLAREDGEAVRIPPTFDTYHQSAVALNSGLLHRFDLPEIPGRLTLTLRFAEAGDALLLEIPGVGSGAEILGAVEVASRAALLAAGETAVLRQGAALLVKLVAGAEEADGRFRAPEGTGAEAHRFVAGVEIRPAVPGPHIVADFEAEDPRLSAGAALDREGPGRLAWDLRPGAAPGGGFALDLGGQDWSAYGALEIAASVEAEGPGRAAGYRVYLVDAEAGLVDLGRHGGAARIDLSALAPELRDSVEALVLRAEPAAVGQPGAVAPGQRLAVEQIALAPGFEARPVDLPHVIPAGGAFSIAAAAIAGAQKAGEVEILSVEGAVGGRASLSAAGVLFETEPGFAGRASATVTLRDAEGRLSESRLAFEVAG